MNQQKEARDQAVKGLRERMDLEIRKKMFLSKEELEMDPVYMAYKYDDYKKV